MGRAATTRLLRRASAVFSLTALTLPLWGQRASVRPVILDWRRIGNAAVDLALPGLATGPVEGIWFADEGNRIIVRTKSGKLFETKDFETWRLSRGQVAPEPDSVPVAHPPEPAVIARRARRNPARVYAIGRWVWRSDDGGASWANLTEFKGHSILGQGLTDIAVSPANPDELVVASEFGVWRSLDGGLSWAGLNDGLPNLPVRRLLGLPDGARGFRLLLHYPDPAGTMEVEWAPGEKSAWKPSSGLQAAQEAALRAQLSVALEAEITAAAPAGSYLYAGSADGRLWASPDGGQTWLPPWRSASGPVESIYVETAEPRVAIAALGAVTGPRVLRTVSGGAYWRDLTQNLPAGAVYKVAADLRSGALYAATSKGVYYTMGNLLADANPTDWAPATETLPPGEVHDLWLDPAGNQIYAVVDGWGVFVAIAPHRLWEPRLVGAADFVERPAAPGALLSVLGARVRAARTGNMAAPVLDAGAAVSQIQVPFEATGASLRFAIEAESGRWDLGLPLQKVSPAIFVDPEGAPFILDAENGVILDARSPARSGARIQILAAGLGRVRPDWPTGLAAPLENPPQVAAEVKVYLDRIPLRVRKATLAPGYVGFYLVEAEIPEMINRGALELYLEADGIASNRVRLYVEP